MRPQTPPRFAIIHTVSVRAVSFQTHEIIRSNTTLELLHCNTSARLGSSHMSCRIVGVHGSQQPTAPPCHRRAPRCPSHPAATHHCRMQRACTPSHPRLSGTCVGKEALLGAQLNNTSHTWPLLLSYKPQRPTGTADTFQELWSPCSKKCSRGATGQTSTLPKS